MPTALTQAVRVSRLSRREKGAAPPTLGGASCLRGNTKRRDINLKTIEWCVVLMTVEAAIQLYRYEPCFVLAVIVDSRRPQQYTDNCQYFYHKLDLTFGQAICCPNGNGSAISSSTTATIPSSSSITTSSVYINCLAIDSIIHQPPDDTMVFNADHYRHNGDANNGNHEHPSAPGTMNAAIARNNPKNATRNTPNRVGLMPPAH